MSHYRVGCDAHKHYSLFAVLDDQGRLREKQRVDHEPGTIRDYLAQFPEGTPVALESVGNWYWIVDEIEAAGCVPRMAHALFAKKMMAHIHKTDKLDAQGLATLEHLGSLPTVWIAPGEIRDARELPRTRMAFSKMRTALKNRMHSTLAKYNLSLDDASDIYAPKWRPQLLQLIDTLPQETARCMHQELEMLGQVQDHIDRLEARIKQRIKVTESMQLVQSLPGVGTVLAIVIALELGAVDRFPSPSNLASYSGTVPKVKSSGGKQRHGRMVKQANNYLKWAFIEAANVVVMKRNHPIWRRKHVSVLYDRIRRRKSHAVAVGAVARHLAEATFWVLTKAEPYQDPMKVSPKQGQARG
ncbi:MAG: IS110 family transposase [Anaerolineae bacterium]|nr:IS110 family transposase [Anaerolineae bacterium]